MPAPDTRLLQGSCKRWLSSAPAEVKEMSHEYQEKRWSSKSLAAAARTRTRPSFWSGHMGGVVRDFDGDAEAGSSSSG